MAELNSPSTQENTELNAGKPYKIRIEMEGLERIMNALTNHSKQLMQRTQQIMVEEMQMAVEESRTDAGGRGWKLAGEIVIVEIGNMTVTGGCTAWYAGFPEFGTIYQHAQPYWRPYVWNHAFTLVNRLTQLQKELMM